MDADPTCPRALLQRDARALIGLLAVVEGHAMAGTFDPLNHRVRYSLGERDDPPQSVPVP
ncbi:hypothetical protein ACI789_21360 [Geodermatophilus sp. SYSU D00965]